MTDDRRQTADRPQFKILNSKFAIRALFWWAVVSLIAIVIVEVNAVAGLVVAILGGVILGIRLFAK
jgi:hypothetical protein